MGKFVVKKQSNGEFMFNLVSGSNTILTSEGYKNRLGCLNGIESVKENSQIDSRYEKRTSARDLPYFVLKSRQGEVIGNSEEYNSEMSMYLGIGAVKRIAPTAEIENRIA